MNDPSPAERYIDLWFTERAATTVETILREIGVVQGNHGRTNSVGGSKYFHNIARVLKAAVLLATDEALAHFSERGLIGSHGNMVRSKINDLHRAILDSADPFFRNKRYGGDGYKGIAGREIALIAEAVQLKIDIALARIAMTQPAKSEQAEVESPSSVHLKAAPWTQDHMCNVIRALVHSAGHRDRERIWKEHLKDQEKEHGWNNTAFREVWSAALNSQGQPGRPKSA